MLVPTLVALVDVRPDRPFWGRPWVKSSLEDLVPGLAPASATEVLEGWCVGGCMGAETLVQSRPIARPTDDPVDDLLRAPVRCTLGAFHSRPAGALPTATPPRAARFRRWLGVAVAPALPEDTRAEMLAALPPFLARDARGQPDVQLLLLRTLAFLFGSAGFRQAYAEPAAMADALDALAQAYPCPAARALMMSDGRTVAALHHGGTLVQRVPPEEIRPTTGMRPEPSAFVPASLLQWRPDAELALPQGARRIDDGVVTVLAGEPGEISVR